MPNAFGSWNYWSQNDSGLIIPSKSILKNQENRDYVWVLSEKEDNIYTVPSFHRGKNKL